MENIKGLLTFCNDAVFFDLKIKELYASLIQYELL